jgi:hypothetical protein
LELSFSDPEQAFHGSPLAREGFFLKNGFSEKPLRTKVSFLLKFCGDKKRPLVTV